MGKHRSVTLPAALISVLLMIGAAPGAQESLAAGPVQPATSSHLVVQLTTQAPVAPLPGAPDIVYTVDGFERGSDVWVAVPPVVNGDDISGEPVRIYVTRHRQRLADWTKGTALKDLSGGWETAVLQPGEAVDNYVLVWAGGSRLGLYDVVVDREPFGVYIPGIDLLDHRSLIGGFNLFPGGSVDYLLVSPAAGCTRIFGTSSYPGGLFEPTEAFVADGWNNGTNGIPENGGGDDVYIGQVTAAWSTNIAEASGRINSANGLFFAGYLTTTAWASVTATYSGATDGTAEIMVSPPSWAP